MLVERDTVGWGCRDWWMAVGVGRSIRGRIDLIAVLYYSGVMIVRFSTSTVHTARKG